jgi:hypothetical protein
MATIAHFTKRALQEKPFIHEALAKGLINLGALSEMLRPEIERELKEKVKESAISMAIRRYMDSQEKSLYKRVSVTRRSEMQIKSNLMEMSIRISPNLFKKLIRLYKVVSFDEGDTLNIIQGNFEVLVLASEKYEKKFLEVLKGDKIKKVRKGLSAISIRIPQEYADIPGFYFALTRPFAMANIPIIEIVNTENEATLVVDDSNVAKSYDLLKQEISFEYYAKP